MALVMKEDVKKVLEYERDTNDTLIETLITVVETDVKEQLNGVTFDAASSYNTETDYYDGDDTDTLLCNKFPIRSLTSLHINTGTPRTYGTDDLVSSDNILDVDYDKGIIRLDGLTFASGYKTVKVVYTAGWKKTDAPADLKLSIIYDVIALLLESVGGINVVEAQDFIYKPDKLRKTASRLRQKYLFIR